MLLILHVGAISLTTLIVIYADEVGLEWFLGIRPRVPERLARRLHALVSCGLALIIGSGIALAVPRITYLLFDTVFFVKLGFVAALVLNVFLVKRLSMTAAAMEFRELEGRERAAIYVSALVSTAGWMGAVVCGLLLT